MIRVEVGVRLVLEAVLLDRVHVELGHLVVVDHEVDMLIFFYFYSLAHLIL